MEVGFFPKTQVFTNLEQVSKPNRQKVQKLEQSDPSFLLKEGASTEGIKTQESNAQEKDINKVKSFESLGRFSEVKLYNSDFGFNDSTKDFFIKVNRGTFVESKYPTDEMLRLKFYLNNLDKNTGVA